MLQVSGVSANLGETREPLWKRQNLMVRVALRTYCVNISDFQRIPMCMKLKYGVLQVEGFPSQYKNIGCIVPNELNGKTP